MSPSKKSETAAPEPEVASVDPSVVSSNGDAPFTLDDLRLPQNFAGLAGVKRAFLTIPIRKPRPQSFIRVRFDDAPDVMTQLLILKEDRDDVYLVAPKLWKELQTEISPYILAPTIDRQGNVTVWPLRVPASDGRANSNTWHVSALQAAQFAKHKWIRCAANMALGCYDVFTAAADLPDPEWPDLTTEQIIQVAFKDKFIAVFDHPVLRKLRGEL